MNSDEFKSFIRVFLAVALCAFAGIVWTVLVGWLKAHGVSQ